MKKDSASGLSAADEVAAAEPEYCCFFENAVEGPDRITADGRLLVANQALAHIAGYDSPPTVLAADGAAGLAAVQAHRGLVRLALIDLMMPVMDGSALARARRESEPAIKIVVMSGPVPDEKQSELHALGLHDILMKAFAPDELINRVTRALAGKSVAS